MKSFIRLAGLGAVIALGLLILDPDDADGGRGGRGGGGGGRGGGGGGRGGGGVSRPSGGGASRPSGGGVSRPSGGASRPSGGGASRPSAPSINRSPSVSAPKISQPKVGGGPKIGSGPQIGSGPKVGSGPKISTGGPGPGARDGPGIVSQPAQRPSIGKGDIGKPGPGGIGGVGGVGKPGGVGGIGKPGPGGVGGVGGVGKPGGVGGIGKPGPGGIGGVGGVGKPGGVGGVGKPGPGGIGGVGGIGKPGGVGGVGKPGGPGGVGGIGNRPSTLPGLGLGLGAGLAAGKAGDVLGRRQENIGDRGENVANRSENLQNRLNDRQDFRDQSQDQRQDYANNRREDWQNWHDDYHGHHNDWYHGGWCDHWGDNWSHMWSDHTAAMVLGTTMWGLNRMNYWFGYGAYENPYYSEPLVIDNTTINYSEPLAAPPEAPPQTTAAPAALPPGVTQEGMDQFEAARTAFHDGNYQAALQATNKALASMPKDAVIHEFRGLVLFALGKYKDAATTLHPVLAVSPGWDWTTMSSLYPDTDTYTKQLRALEEYVNDTPKSSEAHFVLGYHYLVCGHQEKAAAEFLQVQKMLPGDSVSAQLLQMLGKSPPPETADDDTTIKIDASKLIGKWSANRGSKATFELTLDKNHGFTWIYREGKKKEEVKGAYAVDGNVLALEPDAGGVMLAEVTEPKGGSFVFRTVGAAPGDKGLTFASK